MSNIYILATQAAAFRKSTVLPPGIRIHRGTDPVTGQPIHLRWTGIKERELKPKPVDPVLNLFKKESERITPEAAIQSATACMNWWLQGIQCGIDPAYGKKSKTVIRYHESMGDAQKGN